MPEEGNEFSAAPKVVRPKKKYKEKEPQQQDEEEIKLIYNNLMWDKRVFRGNTYSALVTSKNVEIPHANTTKKGMKIIKEHELDEMEDTGNRRANIEIFTDQFVQTLTDKPPRYEYGAQTQFKIEKEVVRHQIPIKQGTDIETQIWDDELFDFDYEVQPLLSVLVARTLEISRMEVLQEEELSIMRNRQRQLHLEQQMERKKIQQMYAKQQQLQQENAKRLQGLKRERQKKARTHQKLFSRVMAKQYLRDIKPNTLAHVEGQGFFKNKIEADLIEKILPKFYNQSLKEQHLLQQWSNYAEEIVSAAKALLVKQNKWAKEVERERRQKILDKRAQLAREKNERKMMKQEEELMKQFLIQEKIRLQKEEEERKKAEEQPEQEQS